MLLDTVQNSTCPADADCMEHNNWSDMLDSAFDGWTAVNMVVLAAAAIAMTVVVVDNGMYDVVLVVGVVVNSNHCLSLC